MTTAATLLFGLLGATLAAPVTATALRIIELLRGSWESPHTGDARRLTVGEAAE